VVSPRRRRDALPDRRHLVADRDRRHADHAAARRHDLKPGSAAKPFFGDRSATRRRRGQRCSKAQPQAISCITDSWPGQMRTVYGDHAALRRYLLPHLSRASTSPATAAAAMKTAITGSPAGSTTCINVSGHRIGTAEVESALVAHPKVAEAAVVGYPARHQGTGHLRLCDADGGVDAERRAAQGARRLGAQGNRARSPTPDVIQFAPGLPKTRSGKIMRRILRKIAENDFANLGDTSTLADPAVVDDLVKNRASR